MIKEDVLLKAAELLSVRPVGQSVFGWHEKSVGVKAVLGDSSEAWLRVISREDSKGQLWTGELDAAAFKLPNKPSFFGHIDWMENGTQFRATLHQYVSSIVISRSPHLDSFFYLTPTWLETLSSNLKLLADVKTNRINVRQDLIDRRINERFNVKLHTKVEDWSVIHGDLHYSNLTKDGPFFLDWEGWGKGPKGLDEAYLSLFSIGVPEVYEQVVTHFKSQLSSPSGIISQLFACCELMRMTELYGDHPHLYSKFQNLSEELSIKLKV